MYGEAQVPSPQNLAIDGYICYLHCSKISSDVNFRRGLAIFFLEKYRYRLTREYACRNYDIVWMKLKVRNGDMFFCFFYSPGSHHPLPVRMKFYDHFSREFQKYASRGKVFLVGDTNARLGSVLNDRNSKGQVITNSNKPLFMDFLEYSGLSILNSIYCKGIPTYEIVNRKKSIIDLCLTNSPEMVQNFEVETTPFGFNSQTCHKALVTTIMTNQSEQVHLPATRRAAYGRLSRRK